MTDAAMLQVPPERTVDLFAQEGLAPDARFNYEWNEFAQWQLGALRYIGMESGHRLLDIGCGPLRFGILAMNYLKNGHYYGVEAFEPYIRIGKHLASEYSPGRKLNIIYDNTFQFEEFGSKFDYAIAQSVLTHMSRSQITNCFEHLGRVMKPGSRFLFTFIQGRTPRGFLYAGSQPMMNPGHCSIPFLKQAAETVGARYESVDGLEHPTQEVATLVF